MPLTEAGDGTLYLKEDHAIVRLDLATGKITETQTPVLDQFGSFIADRDWVIWKPVDPAAGQSGTIVRVGGQPHPLPDRLERGASRLYLAGKGDLWRLSEHGTRRGRLASRLHVDGTRAGTSFRVPARFGIPISDGRDGFIVTSVGGVYAVTKSGVGRITTGHLLAVGRNHLLVWDCDAKSVCRAYNYDRRTHHRKAVSAARSAISRLYSHEPSVSQPEDGLMSPDGRYVALQAPRGGTGSQFVIIDLSTGRTHEIPGAVTATNSNAQAAWSPNGRWLFAVTDHRLRAYVAHTGRSFAVRQTGQEDVTNVAVAGEATN